VGILCILVSEPRGGGDGSLSRGIDELIIGAPCVVNMVVCRRIIIGWTKDLKTCLWELEMDC
jgi:hypothetical protein